MRKLVLLFILVTISIALFLIYQNKKTNIYVTLIDMEGYNFHFNDSVTPNINKMVITQEGKLSYQWWEIEIDSDKIETTSREKLYGNVICSPYFILYNFGWNRDLVTNLDKYRLFIIHREDGELFILPVKDIHFIIE